MEQAINLGLVFSDERLKQDLRGALYTLPVRQAFEADASALSGIVSKIEETRPDVVMLEMAAMGENLADAIRQIKASAGTPMVIAVHSDADSQMVLSAIRANADEYVFPPFGEDLRKALQKIAAERMKVRAGTRPRGKVAGVLSAKGGCGASTIACHLAVGLQRATQLQVLLADYDLDAGMIAFLMKSQSRYSVLDAVDNVERLDASFWKALVSNGIPGLEVIRSQVGTPGFRERKWEDFGQVLRFTRSAYDWTVVDLGRSLTRMAMTVLGDLDEVLLVTTPDLPALHQAKMVIQSLGELGYATDRLRLILNRATSEGDVSLTELQEMIGLPIYYALPDQPAVVYEAYANGGLVGPDTHLGNHIGRLAAKLAGVQAEKKKKKFLFF